MWICKNVYKKAPKIKEERKEFQKKSHWSFGFYAKQHTHSFRQNNLVWLILLPCSWFHADASKQQIVVANNPEEIPVFCIGFSQRQWNYIQNHQSNCGNSLNCLFFSYSVFIFLKNFSFFQIFLSFFSSFSLIRTIIWKMHCDRTCWRDNWNG